jgi:ATP:corrinoid adenosyltransferase
LKDVADEFRLEGDQRLAFFMAGLAWLDSLLVKLDIKPSEREQFRKEHYEAMLKVENGDGEKEVRAAVGQLIMCVTGEAGTGKSEVIKAMEELAQRWGHPQSLCLSAPTGQAACAIMGMTWHSATRHKSFSDCRKKRRRARKATEDERAAWAPVTMMIIDEFSMLSADELHDIDQWLRELKGKADQVFGGIHSTSHALCRVLGGVRSNSLFWYVCSSRSCVLWIQLSRAARRRSHGSVGG